MLIPEVFGRDFVVSRPERRQVVGRGMWRFEGGGPDGMSLVMLRDISRGRTMRLVFSGPQAPVAMRLHVDGVLLDWYEDTADISYADLRSILEDELPPLAALLEAAG